MTPNKKIKTINNKIEQNKAQYNLDRQTKYDKYEFLTSKDVLPEKELLEKADTTKRFEYSLLGTQLKKQTSGEEK